MYSIVLARLLVVVSGSLFKLPAETTPTHVASPSVSPNLFVAPTIKILHQDPFLKRFSRKYVTYSALTLCEDLMRNSNLASDLGKIAFVCSQLEPDSRAARIMLASAFQPELLHRSYNKFSENFLQVFGSCQHYGGLQKAFRMTDSLTSTADNFEGQTLAAQIADDAMLSLRKSSW